MRAKNTTYLYRLPFIVYRYYRKVCACTRHERLIVNKLHFLLDAVMFTVYFTHESRRLVILFPSFLFLFSFIKRNTMYNDR